MKKVVKYGAYTFGVAWLVVTLIASIILFIAFIESFDVLTSTVMTFIMGALIGSPTWLIFVAPWIMKKIRNDQENQTQIKNEMIQYITDSQAALQPENFLINTRGPYFNYLLFRKLWKWGVLSTIIVLAAGFLIILLRMIFKI